MLTEMQGEVTHIEEDYLERLTEVAVRCARKVRHTTRDTRRRKQNCKSDEEHRLWRIIKRKKKAKRKTTRKLKGKIKEAG